MEKLRPRQPLPPGPAEKRRLRSRPGAGEQLRDQRAEKHPASPRLLPRNKA